MLFDHKKNKRILIQKGGNMKKILIIFILCIGTAFGTDTRINVMGAENAFIRDIANIHEFPSVSVVFPPQVVGELKDTIFLHQSALVLIPFGSTGMFGIILNRKHLPSAVDSAINRSGAPFAPHSFHPFFDVILAKKFGKIALGIKYETGGLSYSEDKPEGDTLDLNKNINFSGYGAGISLLFSSFYADLSYILRQSGFEYKTFSETYCNKGGTQHNISLRFSILPSEAIEFPVFLKYSTVGTGWEHFINDSLIADETIEFFSISGGAGVVYHPFENVSLLSALKYEENKERYISETSVEKNVTSFPLFIFAGETRIWDWLCGRIGVIKRIYTVKTTEDQNIYNNKFSVYDLRTGLSFILNDFQIDVELSDDFVFKGPFFLSGKENIALNAGITYYFK